MLRTKIFAAVSIIFCALPLYGLADASEKYVCERQHFFDRWVDRVGNGATGRKITELKSGEKMKAGCGFGKGHRIRLGDSRFGGWIPPDGACRAPRSTNSPAATM